MLLIFKLLFSFIIASLLTNEGTGLSGNFDSSDNNSGLESNFVDMDVSEDGPDSTESTAGITLPRLLKRDIRRTYANMLINVSNSLDISLAESFYTTFTNNQFVYKTFVTEITTPDKIEQTEFIGIPSYLQYLFNRFQLTPDAIHKMSNVMITANQENAEESIITFQHDIKVTKIFDVPFEVVFPTEVSRTEETQNITENSSEQPAIDKQRKLYNLIKPKNRLAVPGGFRTEQTIHTSPQHNTTQTYDNSVTKLIQRTPKVDKILTVTITGTISMVLDSNKFIREISFVATRSREMKVM